MESTTGAASAAELGSVLITGANGQLGRRLIAALRSGSPARGVPRAVVRSQRAADTLRALPDGDALDVRILDYADAAALAEAAQGCRFAVHLVGIIKETRANSYESAHEAPSRALAEAAASAGLERVVALSIPGSDPASPNACLASKGRGEQILFAGKTPATALRVAMVLGPGDTTAGIVRGEALAKLLPLVGGGASHTQPIFADDVVAAILSALVRPELADVALDLAGPESLPQRDFIARAGRLYGRTPRVLPIPLWLAKAVAALLARVVNDPPLTPAMLDVITHHDEIDSAATARRLGIELTPLDEQLRRCVGPEALDS